MAEKSKNGWVTLIIVTLSVFTIVIDKTFLNVAIYTLIRDLNTTIQTIQAIIAIYSLVMASLMLFGGKLQDVFGRKKTFLMGASIYGAGTIVAALSINSAMLLLGFAGGLRGSEIGGLDGGRDQTEDGRGWIERRAKGLPVRVKNYLKIRKGRKLDSLSSVAHHYQFVFPGHPTKMEIPV